MTRRVRPGRPVGGRVVFGRGVNKIILDRAERGAYNGMEKYSFFGSALYSFESLIKMAADQILKENQRRRLEEYGEVDFACFDSEVGRFRLNVFRQRNSVALVARILTADIPEPKSLGIPDSVVEASHKKSGLILVTGPTGVGKTTTIASAVTAAETGHLVFSTLHTPNSFSTVDRIIDVFPPHQQQIRTQLAEVLECVVSQQLLPRSNGEGRVAAMEVMLSNKAIRSCIRDGKAYQLPSIIQINKSEGMQTMEMAIAQLYVTGKITREIAFAYANDRDMLKHFIG